MTETEINSLIKSKRDAQFLMSNQISIGQLISAIEKAETIMSGGYEKDICYDFGTAIPTKLRSWRGSYNELALGYELSGHDVKGGNRHMKASDLLSILKSSIGETFEGYKGGDFIMNDDTPIWVANYGDSGNTAIIGVLVTYYNLIILTSYCEY